jgi:hypothetical protein
MFQQNFAIIRRSCLPQKLFKQYLCFGIAATELPFRVHLGLKLAGPLYAASLVSSAISICALCQATLESSVSEERKLARNVR